MRASTSSMPSNFGANPSSAVAGAGMLLRAPLTSQPVFAPQRWQSYTRAASVVSVTSAGAEQPARLAPATALPWYTPNSTAGRIILCVNMYHPC
jgi:hypothetical protein